MSDDINEIDALWAPAPQAISWDDDPPITVHGTVLDQEKAQQTDFKTRVPLFWPDNRPKLKVVVSLQVQEATEDDDGVRQLHVNIPGGVHTAIKDALKEAHLRTLGKGDILDLTYTEEVDTAIDGSRLPKGQKRKCFEALVESGQSPPF